MYRRRTLQDMTGPELATLASVSICLTPFFVPLSPLSTPVRDDCINTIPSPTLPACLFLTTHIQKKSSQLNSDTLVHHSSIPPGCESSHSGRYFVLCTEYVLCWVVCTTYVVLACISISDRNDWFPTPPLIQSPKRPHSIFMKLVTLCFVALSHDFRFRALNFSHSANLAPVSRGRTTATITALPLN